MGRRLELPAVSADSSSESSFRELDDVFLQTQTRIWVGEVLGTRMDDQMNISDLLADGELLFKVSNIVWSMLMVKSKELRHHKKSIFGKRKSIDRYRPYSNVDSFLKICKILGLNSIDLFSPSDVVEKKNTRSVCMCIRSLSKKARSKQLNVPDFEKVTSVVSMPTDMVGCLRRSWELSQSKHLKTKNGKKHDRKGSDEAESSRYTRMSTQSTSCSYDSDLLEISDSESSPEVSSKLNSHDDDTPEKIYESQGLAFSDLIAFGNDDHFLFDGKSIMFDSLFKSESLGSNFSNKKDSQNGDEFDDVEVSSVASMSSVVGRVLNLDSDDQFDIIDDVQNAKVDDEFSTPLWDDFSDIKHVQLEDDGDSVRLEPIGNDKPESYFMVDNDNFTAERFIISKQGEKGNGELVDFKGYEYEDENISTDGDKYEDENISTELVHEEEAVAKISPKREKKILLKRIAKGTAALGMLLLLLHHLRRNGREKTSEVSWQSGIVCRENEKQKAKCSGAAYPAERLDI